MTGHDGPEYPKLERQQPASLVDVDESVDFLLGALVALIDEGCENALIA